MKNFSKLKFFGVIGSVLLLCCLCAIIFAPVLKTNFLALENANTNLNTVTNTQKFADITETTEDDSTQSGDTVEEITVFTINYVDSSDNNTPIETNNPTTVDTTSAIFPIILQNPENKLGYEFESWGYDSSNMVNVDGDGNFIITQDSLTSWANTEGVLTIRAYWTAIEYPITLVYSENVQNTSVTPPANLKNATYTIKDTIDLTLPENKPNKGGYIFDGWFSDADFTIPITEISNMTGPITLYGHFTQMDLIISFANDEFEDIRFNYDDPAYNQGDITGLLTDKIPTKKGYTFDGWYTDSSLSEASRVGLNYRFYSSVTLYAKWIENPSNVWWWVLGGLGIVTVAGFGLWYWLARPKTMKY